MQTLQYRTHLPKMTDRLRLGRSPLEVSPICFGLVSPPEIVLEAFDMGVNFFFISADLHWPLYEGVRRGVDRLLAARPEASGDIVVAVASYLEQPMFEFLHLHEVMEAIANLRRIDVVVAGAVSSAASLSTRLPRMVRAKVNFYQGVRAVGASFHDRPTALDAINSDQLDFNLIRLNTSHPGARRDLLPGLRPARKGLVYSFTSMAGFVPPVQAAALGVDPTRWLPQPTDHYRYVLSHAAIDGILCAPRSLEQLAALQRCLDCSPLDEEQMGQMEEISRLAEQLQPSR